MDTENRKSAGDARTGDPAEESAGAPGDEGAAQTDDRENIEPGKGASEKSASGWTAPTGTAAGAAAPQSEMPAEARVESDADMIARLEAEKADLTERLLRAVAEMDNLRKRTEREVVDARKFSIARFAGDMLAVSDNLKRALDAVPPQARDSADEALEALLAGVEMTGREMERMLEKNGVTRIAALGEPFDPHCHQAMFEVPDETVPNRTVVEVVQDGYRIGERILRAAMVGVARGGPKAAPPEAAPPEAAPPEPPQPADDSSPTDLPEPPDTPSDPPEAA